MGNAKTRHLPGGRVGDFASPSPHLPCHDLAPAARTPTLHARNGRHFNRPCSQGSRRSIGPLRGALYPPRRLGFDRIRECGARLAAAPLHRGQGTWRTPVAHFRLWGMASPRGGAAAPARPAPRQESRLGQEPVTTFPAIRGDLKPFRLRIPGLPLRVARLPEGSTSHDAVRQRLRAATGSPRPVHRGGRLKERSCFAAEPSCQRGLVLLPPAGSLALALKAINERVRLLVGILYSNEGCGAAAASTFPAMYRIENFSKAEGRTAGVATLRQRWRTTPPLALTVIVMSRAAARAPNQDRPERTRQSPLRHHTTTGVATRGRRLRMSRT